MQLLALFIFFFENRMVLRAKDLLQESQDIVRYMWDNIQYAQNKQNVYAYQHHIEHAFEVGDTIYLRLYPYRQFTLKNSGSEKLIPRFYGSFQITQWIGKVAYELEVPKSSKVQNAFHTSHLMKVLGHTMIPFSELPSLDKKEN